MTDRNSWERLRSFVVLSLPRHLKLYHRCRWPPWSSRRKENARDCEINLTHCIFSAPTGTKDLYPALLQDMSSCDGHRSWLVPLERLSAGWGEVGAYCTAQGGL